MLIGLCTLLSPKAFSTMNVILTVPAKRTLTPILPFCLKAGQQQTYKALLLSRRLSSSILCNSDNLFYQNLFKTLNNLSWDVTPSSLMEI
jgi:hypothetical protein